MAQQVVLSCIDGSSFSTSVCDYSAWIAKKTDVPLTLLHTVEHGQMPVYTDLSGNIGLGSQQELLNELTELEQSRSKLLLKKGRIMIAAAKQRVIDAGITPVCTQRHGSLAESLIELENSIRVLVIGIRGEQHDAESTELGTQLESVIRSLHKPILVVNRDFSTPRNIMLAYDGSDASCKALQMVASSPLFKDVPCHLVSVNSNEKQNEQLIVDAKQQLQINGIKVVAAKLNGKIDDALCQYQKEHEIDLTVMGAFSHSRIRDFLLGSFTAKMLLKTERPLLLLR